MSYWLISFMSGFLTVLAPCSLFLLPTILVGSTSETNRARPWIVAISLGISVFLFSLIIKGTSLAFVLPNSVWSWISGLLLTLFGLTLLFPVLWEEIATKLRLTKSQNLLEKTEKYKGNMGAILLGAALGPVFSTCSPTFTVLLAVILPSSFLEGAINIGLFVSGMMIPFILIGIGGQKVVKKFRFMANPNGWFRKTLGVILILVGIMIITAFQKTIEKWLLEKGYVGTTFIEQKLFQNATVDSDLQNKFGDFKTDLSKHSIPFDQILSGGPGKEGIPALTNPKFVDLKDSGLSDDTLGIFINLNGDKRFYPFNIMVWHEIVNDTVGGQALAITFCPLCGSAIVFDRKLDGNILDFGVSGFLYQSNLLMYDKQTESLWSQVLGKAVVGSYNEQKLTRVAMQRITFLELKEKYPDAKVLSADTGYRRDYTFNPYGDYENAEKLYFPISVQDQRFFSKEIMLVVPVNNTWVAFPWNKLKKTGGATIKVDEQNLVLTLNGSEVQAKYNGDVLPSYYEMWFSFATEHQRDALIWN